VERRVRFYLKLVVFIYSILEDGVKEGEEGRERQRE